MKCANCKESVIIFQDYNGAIYVLDKPRYGVIDFHKCGVGNEKMLTKSMKKKLEVED